MTFRQRVKANRKNQAYYQMKVIGDWLYDGICVLGGTLAVLMVLILCG